MKFIKQLKQNKVNYVQNKNTAELLFKTMSPVFMVQRLVGVFKPRYHGDTIKEPSKLQKAISALTVTANCILFFFTYKTVRGTNEIANIAQHFGRLLVIFCFSINAAFTTICLGKSNVKILLAFGKMDTMLMINNKEFYDKSRRRNFIVLCIVMTSNAFYTITTYFEDNGSNTIYRAQEQIMSFLIDLESLVFFTFISMINERLKVINKSLTKIIQTNEKKSTLFYLQTSNDIIDLSKFKKVNLKNLAIAYDILGETFHIINQTFNLILFLLLISTFIFVLLTIWETISLIRAKDDVSNFLMLMIVWCFSAITSMATVCWICASLSTTRDHTRLLLNDIITDYCFEKDIRRLAKSFMELIDSWPLQVYIYGMFSVDIALMLKFISVTTTYLIIIAQISHFF